VDLPFFASLPNCERVEGKDSGPPIFSRGKK